MFATDSHEHISRFFDIERCGENLVFNKDFMIEATLLYLQLKSKMLLSMLLLNNIQPQAYLSLFHYKFDTKKVIYVASMENKN